MHAPKSQIVKSMAAKLGIPFVDLPLAPPAPFSLVAGLPKPQKEESQ